jgi:uncharacterized protein YqgC (DUF456 family)
MGIFLGAFLAELIVNKDFLRSLKSGAGSVMGRVGSIIAKLVIALAMLAVILFKIALHYKKV